MTTGVWPDSMVAGVGIDGQEVTGLLELGEELDAGGDIVGRAALGQRGHHHTGERRAGLRRIAVERNLALELRLEQIIDAGDRRAPCGVVTDRHEAAVVVDPGTVGILEVGGDVVERRDLVRREHRGVGQGHRLAQVEHVGRGALALLLRGGVDLFLAGRLRLGRVDLDAVLVPERLDDRRRSSPSPAAAR